MRRVAFICACACVLGLAGSTRAQTRVAFLATGDFGVGGSAELSDGLAMHRYEARHPTDMLVLLGDNDYTESPAHFRSNWRTSFGWARRSGLEVSGVLGNHDFRVSHGRYEFRLLGMPGPYYTRTLGDAELFLLDSNNVNDAQTAWLEQQLTASTAIWKIAVFHEPPYTCGGHLGREDIQERWVPLFERYGVQLVLSGHDHNYERFAARNGVTYVVDGGGGAHLYRLQQCPTDYPVRTRARVEHGFLYVTVTPDWLNGYALNKRGRVTDRFSLQP
ncbi:MAG TPA: metallophosphoesterase [Gaiellaceae bacterium]|nr:metallophosphoesterase [Gaiellaceae bacterium]